VCGGHDRPSELRRAAGSFGIDVRHAQPVDLLRLVAATLCLDRETVADPAQSPRAARIQSVVRYWGTDDGSRGVDAALTVAVQIAPVTAGC